jgi:hypothetical protein
MTKERSGASGKTLDESTKSRQAGPMREDLFEDPDAALVAMSKF